MNNKEEVLILAEMQLKSLGFIDPKVISQSLNIDVEYVNQVIEKQWKVYLTPNLLLYILLWKEGEQLTI